MNKSIYYLLLFLFSTSACVKENDVFEKEVVTISKSDLVISMLDYIINSNNSDACFSLNYPVIFSTNKKNNVTYINQNALNEATSFLDNDFLLMPFYFLLT